MPETAVLRAIGLRTYAGASGKPDEDGLSVAENIVLNRESLWELRRGMAKRGSALTGKTLVTLESLTGEVLTP